MPDPDFNLLREYLLRAGIAPTHVSRAVVELREHLDDLRIDALDSGFDADTAQRYANDRFGDIEEITRRYADRTELKRWSYRHPKAARYCLPVAYALLLPSVPIQAGLASVPTIAKWFAILLLSGLITATMLLVMQISIALS